MPGGNPNSTAENVIFELLGRGFGLVAIAIVAGLIGVGVLIGSAL